MTRQLVFTVGPDGKVKGEAEGHVGVSCREALAVFEQALGGKVLSREDKPELWQGENKQEQTWPC